VQAFGRNQSLLDPRTKGVVSGESATAISLVLAGTAADRKADARSKQNTPPSPASKDLFIPAGRWWDAQRVDLRALNPCRPPFKERGRRPMEARPP